MLSFGIYTFHKRQSKDIILYNHVTCIFILVSYLGEHKTYSNLPVKNLRGGYLHIPSRNAIKTTCSPTKRLKASWKLPPPSTKMSEAPHQETDILEPWTTTAPTQTIPAMTPSTASPPSQNRGCHALDVLASHRTPAWSLTRWRLGRSYGNCPYGRLQCLCHMQPTYVHMTSATSTCWRNRSTMPWPRHGLTLSALSKTTPLSPFGLSKKRPRNWSFLWGKEGSSSEKNVRGPWPSGACSQTARPPSKTDSGGQPRQSLTTWRSLKHVQHLTSPPPFTTPPQLEGTHLDKQRDADLRVASIPIVIPPVGMTHGARSTRAGHAPDDTSEDGDLLGLITSDEELQSFIEGEVLSKPTCT